MRAVNDFTLPKTRLLVKPQQYQAVYRNGRRLRGQWFSLIIMDNGLEKSRLGISVHGVRRAVRRNRIKRIIREFFRTNKDLITPSADIVFAVRKEFSLNSPQEIKQAVTDLLRR